MKFKSYVRRRKFFFLNKNKIIETKKNEKMKFKYFFKCLALLSTDVRSVEREREGERETEIKRERDRERERETEIKGEREQERET